LHYKWDTEDQVVEDMEVVEVPLVEAVDVLVVVAAAEAMDLVVVEVTVETVADTSPTNRLK
jgi:hypothetical protein